MEDLREKQIAALKEMLNFNEKSSVQSPWKILVYDEFGQDIISCLLSVKTLRELGVTLHVSLHSNRDGVPDCPAVYFVQPNERNLKRIEDDLRNGVYDSYYFNFISSIPGEKLQQLASAAYQADSDKEIKKVYDQYLHFISLEKNLFILKQQDSEDGVSFYSLNSTKTMHNEVEIILHELVESLFSVFTTMGAVPFICCSKGQAAKVLAEKLNNKFRTGLNDRTIVERSLSSKRPVLIILDRQIDMATPLEHTWTYQALAHDVLDLRLNRVLLEEPAASAGVSGTQAKTKTFYLEESDNFWTSYKGSFFPEVAEAIERELKEYKESETEVKRLKETMGLLEGGDGMDMLVSDNTAKLTSAVNNLPQLLEKKKLIDMHMTIATALLSAVTSRKLDRLFEEEEKIIGRSTSNRSIADLLADPTFASGEDKLRLFLIYFLCTTTIPKEELEQLTSLLREEGCDVAALTYLKQQKVFSETPLASSRSQDQSLGYKTFSRLVQYGVKGVKSLVTKKHYLPVTTIVNQVMEGELDTDTDPYSYYDPKTVGKRDSGKRSEKWPKAFKEAVVFMVGGGNYIEFQNLMDYANPKLGSTGEEKRIIYGSSCVYSASDFLKQLTRLGQEVKP